MRHTLEYPIRYLTYLLKRIIHGNGWPERRRIHQEPLMHSHQFMDRCEYISHGYVELFVYFVNIVRCNKRAAHGRVFYLTSLQNLLVFLAHLTTKASPVKSNLAKKTVFIDATFFLPGSTHLTSTVCPGPKSICHQTMGQFRGLREHIYKHESCNCLLGDSFLGILIYPTLVSPSDHNHYRFACKPLGSLSHFILFL